MPSLNAGGPHSPQPDHLGGFNVAPPKTVLKGPLTLHRFGDATGIWWFEPALIKELKEDFLVWAYSSGPDRNDPLMSQRDDLAVRFDWNHLRHFSTLSILDGEHLDAFVGPVAPQPAWTTQPNGQVLYGGATQYLIYNLSAASRSHFKSQSVVDLYKKWSR
jgi:hypothetical protein